MASRLSICFYSLSLALGLAKAGEATLRPQLRQDVPTSVDPSLVQTTSGLVKGHKSPWPENSDVVEFLGIPYAQPPVGDLRFAAPRQLENATGNLILASNFSMDCLQYVGNAGDTRDATPQLRAYGYAMGGGSIDSPHAYGEDCLTVNVWSKTAASSYEPSFSSASATAAAAQGGKAVLLWIYGGGFSTGTSNAPFYSGARLAQDEDVVVVSFNYRINVFGFPGAPGLPDQNAGLLDQRMAVEWVRDNIAGFGGDPARITLFGESAGASSVDLYAFAWAQPQQDPIVSGFIAQSGSAASPRAPVNATPWFAVSSALGCGGADAGGASVACMRDKSAEDIINTVGKISGGSISAGFGPAADEKVVFSDVRNRSASGNFIKKPLLIGSNDFELGLIRALPAGLGFGGGALSPNSSDQQLQVASELAFGCGAAKSAADRVANGVPAWRYRYMAVWDNVALTNTTGSYHSSEIPFAFGTNARRPNSTLDTEEEAKLAGAMVHAWATFAKDPVGGLAGLGWPQYDPAGSTLIKLGDKNLSALSIGPSTAFDAPCAMRAR